MLQSDGETPLQTGPPRLILFGGEALDLPRRAPWYGRRGSSVQHVNTYGITETTVRVTWDMLTTGRVGSGRPNLIGEALPDLTIHLLDPATWRDVVRMVAWRCSAAPINS